MLLALSGPSVVFLAAAATLLWSALQISRIDEAGATPDADAPDRDVLAGLRLLARAPRLRLVVGLYALVSLVYGALGVLTVVAALQLFGLGEAGVGYLTAGFGIGGLLGAPLALLLAPSRLVHVFVLSVLLYGGATALVGLSPLPLLALLALAAVGAANTLIDVSHLTLLQEWAPREALGRVLGVLESLVLVAIAFGALLAPLAASALGTRGALLAFGILPALVAPLASPRLVSAETVAGRGSCRRLRRLHRRLRFAGISATSETHQRP